MATENDTQAWYWSTFPTLSETAISLAIPVDALRGMLMNQRLYVGPSDRVPPAVVFDALQAEIDAGRGYQPQQLQYVNAQPRRSG